MTPDLVETVTPATAGDARRLTTVANVKAFAGITGSADDALLTSLIDRVSAAAADY